MNVNGQKITTFGKCYLKSIAMRKEKLYENIKGKLNIYLVLFMIL